MSDFLTGEDSAWLQPWIAGVLGQVSNGKNPYDVIIPTLSGVFYPRVGAGFKEQMWVLLGLFCVSGILIMAGLLLRLGQGRFWLVHRIDATVFVPNISILYGICALVYAALGCLSIVTAIKIANGDDYPRYYVGLQGAWPGLLWLAMYSELWATFSAYYIRLYGAHYRESWWKTAIASILPAILPVVAFVPSAYFFVISSTRFNRAFIQYHNVYGSLQVFSAAWTPEAGLDIINLTSILGTVGNMANGLIDYSWAARRGFLYSAVVLLVTLALYVCGSYLEISHLRRQAAKLRAQAALSPNMRKKTPLSPQMDRKVAAQLDEEWFSGVVRQASLLEWASTNRTWTASLISLMLLTSAAMSLWYALTPMGIQSNATTFQTIILVSCYVNGILSTLVSLLILFRSLDGSNPSARRLQSFLPWLPLPPAVGLRGQETTQQVTVVYEETPVTFSPMSMASSSMGTPIIQLEMDRKDTDSW